MRARGFGERLAVGAFAMALTCLPAMPSATDAAPAAPESSTHDAHIRTSDRGLQAALDDGLAHSQAFQALVAHLEASDVVVFLAYDRKPGDIASRVSFVSMAGGRRYLLIGMRTRLPRVRQVSILAHELQHAVEIADAPWVTSTASMARYYADLKYAGIVDASQQHRFESRAAIDAENLVAREMRPARALNPF
jgi:hypothetical protein